ncbi:hypothetical protein CARUB_v10027469mg [Capsella rubella]|uniref:Uncharacterized protein n=1 Tax=Capsella rubella TaxID=81985 RepID=R0EU66_9BRAS|nr:hypothetical protein CARUB_v10027469mg [Capsella rubella]
MSLCDRKKRKKERFLLLRFSHLCPVASYLRFVWMRLVALSRSNPTFIFKHKSTNVFSLGETYVKPMVLIDCSIRIAEI